MPFAKSYKYNLFGDYAVEEQVATIYRFKKGNQVVDVPASDIEAVDGWEEVVSERRNRRNNRGTKKARRNRSRYTRRK
jgi:hypothetical protein